MKNYGLRKIRIAVSIVFLLLTAVLFLDITNYIPTNYFNYITFLQFIPSTIKFVNVLTISSIGFIIVLILTLMFGRVYCSSICPLGTIQDIASWIAKKNNRKKKFTFTKEYFWLRYSTLALTIISILFGTLVIVNLLDPYSNTGRILSQLFNPVVTISNNIVAFTLEKFNVYLLYPVEIK